MAPQTMKCHFDRSAAEWRICSLPPQLTPDLAAFYPTTLLVTGFDILFFWVARMIMLGCHFTLDVPMPDDSKRTLADAVPFREVYIHGLVRDADRQKMSKTKGNVINPIDIIERFGTDAVRFTLASMASPGTDIAFSEARTEGYRAFANKIWNAARFLFMNIDRAKEAGIEIEPATNPGAPHLDSEMWVEAAQIPLETRWILTRLSETRTAVATSLADYRFDEAANVIYQFFWGDLCDWYLEIVKLRLNFGENARQTSDHRGPHHTGRSLRGLPPPPKPLHALHHRRDLARPLQRRTAGKIHRPHPLSASRRLPCRSRRSKRDEDPPGPHHHHPRSAQRTQRPRKRIHSHSPSREQSHCCDRRRKSGHALSHGPRAVRRIRQRTSPGSNARSTADFDVAVTYERQIDIPAERERLTKDLAKYEKGLTAAERQLGNEAFMAKAPAHIVEGLRKQSAETKILYDKTRAALDALN